MTEYASYRHSAALTAEVFAKARTPEAAELASRLSVEFHDRTFAYFLDGVFLGSGSGSSDGFITSGHRGGEGWLARVHHEGLAKFVAAAYLVGALESEIQPRWTQV